MTSRLVALLRGINVGRNKRVAMADLRELLRELGYTDVQTILQSGNAVFSCRSGLVSSAASTIERTIADDLAVQCSVIVRTAAEIEATIAADPFGAVATDGSRYLIGFLSADAVPAAAGYIRAIDVPPDRIILVGREVHLWCPTGVLDSPLAGLGWEKALGVPVTVRNQNTVGMIAGVMRD